MKTTDKKTTVKQRHQNRKTQHSSESIHIPPSYTWLTPPVPFSSLYTYLSYLKKQTRKTLGLNQTVSQTIRAIVVPHAGLQYSGLCSMSAYLPASYNKGITTIIILSTDHYNHDKSGLYTTDFYYTDALDKRSYHAHIHPLTKQLLKQYPSYFEERHVLDEIDKEHSLFNQLPFIDALFPSTVRVVPIMVGKNHLHEMSSILAPFMNQKNVLFVCNTDFSHVNGHFKHKLSGNICNSIRQKDSEMVELFLNHQNMDQPFTDTFVDQNEYSLCGYHALQLMKHLLHTNPLDAKLSCYYTSAQLQFCMPLAPHYDVSLYAMTQRFLLTDESISSVSYIGIVLMHSKTTTNRDLSYLLSDYEKGALCCYAMHVVLNHLHEQTPPDQQDKQDTPNKTTQLPSNFVEPLYSPNYTFKKGVFVTIDNPSYTHIDEKQRGCIGTIDATSNTILHNVRTFAIKSAFQDERYSPITLTELVRLQTIGMTATSNVSAYIFLKDFTITLLSEPANVHVQSFLQHQSTTKTTHKRASQQALTRTRNKTNNKHLQGFTIGYDAVNLYYGKKHAVYLTNDYKLHKLGTTEKIVKMLCRKMGEKETCIHAPNIEISYQQGFPILSKRILAHSDDQAVFKLTHIPDMNDSLTHFIHAHTFQYHAIGVHMRKLSKRLTKVKQRIFLYGVLWYYLYTLEQGNTKEVLSRLGFCNCFLFLKQVVQVQAFASLGTKMISIVFDDFFCNDLNEHHVPKEMVKDDITGCFGMIQWLFMGSPKHLKTLCRFLDIICEHESYAYLFDWTWLHTTPEEHHTTDKQHYVHHPNAFHLYYGLYLTEWVFYNLDRIQKIIKQTSSTWMVKLIQFKNRLDTHHLSLRQFILSLLKIRHTWNPTQNTNLAWLVNHIPYFLSAFYQYDLRNCKPIQTKTNTGWNAIIQFIMESAKHIQHMSWDYYGECMEILNKLGYDVKPQLQHIQNNIIQPKTRSEIIQNTGNPFSDIHTIVTYVMQPHADDIVDDDMHHGYGAYVQQILQDMHTIKNA